MIKDDLLIERLKTQAIERGVSERELETLLLALEGRSSQEIANMLGLSDIAVRKRLGEVYRKFGVIGRGPGKLAELKRIFNLPSSFSISSVVPARRFQISHPIHIDPTPEKTIKPHDWGKAPHGFALVGREQEVTQLKDWILDKKYRLITVLGSSGIGKTSLSVHVGREIDPQFEYVIYRSLHRYSGNPPTPTELLWDWLSVFRGKTYPIKETNLDVLFDELLERLTAHRTLIILDDIEGLFSTDSARLYYKDNYWDYKELFKIIGETEHKGCLILNSVSKPTGVSQIESVDYVGSLQLSGLDSSAVVEFFKDYNLSMEDVKPAKRENVLKMTAELTMNNTPLLLLILAKVIQTTTNDIEEFFNAPTRYISNPYLVITSLAEMVESLKPEEKAIFLYVLNQSQAVSLSALDTYINSEKAKEANPSNATIFSILTTLTSKNLLAKQDLKTDIGLQPHYQVNPLFFKYLNNHSLVRA